MSNFPEEFDPRLRTIGATEDGTVFESHARWNRGKPSGTENIRQAAVDLHQWRTHYPTSAPRPVKVDDMGQPSGNQPVLCDEARDPEGKVPALWHRPAQLNVHGDWHQTPTHFQQLIADMLDRLWGAFSRIQRRCYVRRIVNTGSKQQ